MTQVPFNEVLRSYIETLQVERGKARLRGWVFHPRLPIDSLSISLDGIPWIEGVQPIDVPEVQAAYPDYPCALKVGFDVSAPVGAGLDPHRTTIAITPTSTGRPLDTVRTGYLQPALERRSHPQPPEHLQERVGGTGEFVEIGFQLMTLVRTYMEKHKPFPEAERILDWGCGCARVLAQLQKFVPAGKLHGCDIDAEAIQWNRQHLPGLTFQTVGPYPPTSYPDGFFDAVYGISVMTHFDEETQFAWLSELTRITRPGAVLMLSVIGDKLRGTNMPASLAATYAEKGFAVMVPGYSGLLSAFSHEDYYKEAYHSRAYVAENWSRYFDVVEYVETQHQDLVVMRARRDTGT